MYAIFSPNIGSELDLWIISPSTCAPTLPAPNACSGAGRAAVNWVASDSAAGGRSAITSVTSPASASPLSSNWTAARERLETVLETIHEALHRDGMDGRFDW